jgi:Lhr-like helicase
MVPTQTRALTAILAEHYEDAAFGRRFRWYQARQGLGFDVTRGAALAGDAHQDLTETIVELADVSQHTHPVNVASGSALVSMQCLTTWRAV